MKIFTPSKTCALEFLNKFINNELKNYTFKRNYDFGATQRDNVSCLSPYITHGVVQEINIIQKSLSKFSYDEIEKFIQEVLWRNYWKGWLELRPNLWSDFLYNLQEIKSDHKNNINYLKAINGETNIQCFDDWAHELKKYNYLHNHTRMWFASIWIFTLKLPWQLGAEFFMKYLFDGDPASNTLGWRWVAGIQTIGKHYLATSENINKYTNNKYSKLNLNEKAEAINNTQTYSLINKKFQNPNLDEVKEIIVFDNYLNMEEDNLTELNLNKIYLVENDNENRVIKLDENILSFKKKLIFDQSDRLKKLSVNHEVININDLKNLKQVDYAIYPNIGENLDFINKNLNNIIFIHRKIDQFSWDFCNKGFFNFKKNIPDIINNFI